MFLRLGPDPPLGLAKGPARFDFELHLWKYPNARPNFMVLGRVSKQSQRHKTLTENQSPQEGKTQNLNEKRMFCASPICFLLMIMSSTTTMKQNIVLCTQVVHSAEWFHFLFSGFFGILTFSESSRHVRFHVSFNTAHNVDRIIQLVFRYYS